MNVKNVMTKSVVWVKPGTSVQEAAGKMKDLNIGVLPVYDCQDLVGIVTDRDIVLRSTADGKSPKSSKVAKVMSHQVEYCLEDEEIEAVARKMEEKKIRRLPVMDHNKRLVGMISLGDLAARGEQKAACEVLEEVSLPDRK